MRYKIALLGVMLGIAFVISTASAQEECPQTITVVAGTEIQLAATPVNQTVYRYLWDNSSAGAGVLVFNSTDLPWTKFNAPQAAGTYKVTVTVTPKLAEACVNSTCITIITTSPTCPLCPATVCVTKEPTSGCPPVFDYTGTEAPGYTYNYTINGDEVATTSDYTLDWDLLTQPTDAIPVVNSTVCFKLKDSAGNLLVDNCCEEIRMVYEPKPVITHNP